MTTIKLEDGSNWEGISLLSEPVAENIGFIAFDKNKHIVIPGDMSNVEIYKLYGPTSDRVAIQRERRRNKKFFFDTFVLDEDYDYVFKINREGDLLTLEAHFQTACGRYAHWRIVNNSY